MLPFVAPVEYPAEYPADVCFAESATVGLNTALNTDRPGKLSPCSKSQPPQSQLQLDFSELPSFTTIRDQYRDWGVAITDAIAIRPSNPAFVRTKLASGLMPTAQNQTLSIQFQQLRQFVSFSLAGAQQITLRAYDTSHRLVAEQQVGQSDYRQMRQASAACIHHQVQLIDPSISQIEIYSDAPFLLFDLACSA